MNYTNNILAESWTIREEEFWQLTSTEDRSRFVLSYALLAPSRLNTQPWLFTIDGDSIHVMADRRRCLAVVDPADRQLTISCGAALHNLVLAMRRFGHDPEIHTFPDLNRPDLMATVRWGAEKEPSDYSMAQFRAITTRRTRGILGDGVSLPDSDLEELELLASRGPVELSIIRETTQRHKIFELIKAASEEQFLDFRYQREHASWTHPSRRRSRDGIPGRLLDPAHRRNAGVVSRPRVKGFLKGEEVVLAVLTTRNDSHSAWLDAGCSLQSLLLGATRLDVQAAFLSHPLELPGYREQLNVVLGSGKVAQVMMAFGRAGYVRATPRRDLDDVLTPRD
ncbi:hypothetical protein JYT20_00495 [Rhodothermus sp. AH-315-K08]|nr:hypothetical protein [Rhodothermus sp. AH-315-K08]